MKTIIENEDNSISIKRGSFIEGPGLGSLLTTCISYWVMEKALRCVDMREEDLPNIYIKYAALGFGLLTTINFNYFNNDI